MGIIQIQLDAISKLSRDEKYNVCWVVVVVVVYQSQFVIVVVIAYHQAFIVSRILRIS